jgi:5-methylcytosine-specific restriction protein A
MATQHWTDDDAGYEDWIASHPAGFLANLKNPPGGQYFRIHRATCRLPDRSLPGSTNPRTGRGYSKVTADTVAELIAWARAHLPELRDFTDANYCKICTPTE